MLQLVQRAFVPSESMIAKIGILGADVRELVETITYNIEQTKPQDARFQRKVMHIGIPTEVLPAFRTLSAKQAQKLLENLDAWLSEHDLSSIPQAEWASTARVGVGIHYFEQILAPGAEEA